MLHVPCKCRCIAHSPEIANELSQRAQYSNIIGTLGRIGPNGLNTVFLEDLRTLYVDEDIPKGYTRRELPFYSPEGQSYIDRMSHHIGFQIERPWPEGDQDGRDVEPLVARYEMN